MAKQMNYILTKTVVRKAIMDIKTDPERTVRNLVDMALHFTDSRFQKNFFASAQKLLSDEHSGYYALVKDTLTKVNEETLLTFSMNMGYGGLYEGSRKIRSAEAEKGFNIPWTIAVSVGEKGVNDRHHLLIRQGQEMGIRVWQLFSEGSILECLSLAAQYPESAFIIYCGSGEIDLHTLDVASDLHNIALIVPYDDQADVVCALLREAGLLYGLHYAYCDKDKPRIESGALFEDMQSLYPLACVLRHSYPCNQECCDQVSLWIRNARMEQNFKTILWEMYGDALLIDEVISNEPCWVGFDLSGQLNTQFGRYPNSEYNIFKIDLPDILRQAFPQKA